MSALYVCLFSNGHLKVGRSVNALARIAQHEERVSCLGVELVDYRVFDCITHPGSAEAALIERCVEACSKRNKNEWFEGVDFDSACEWAAECASTPITSGATNVIEALGGVAEVARIFKIAMPSVSNWKHEGIPDARMMYLKVAYAAQLKGVDLDAATSQRRAKEAA